MTQNKLFDNVIFYLQKKYDFANNKEVAEFLNINYGTFRNAVSADKVPFSLLIELAKKEDIDLQRLFFGQQKNEELMLVLYEALSVSDEIEVKKILKQHILEKIFSKIFVKKRGFVEKIFNAFEWKTQRIIHFLLVIFCEFEEVFNNHTVEKAKDLLLARIRSLDIYLLSEKLDFKFSTNDKETLLNIVGLMDDEECSNFFVNLEQTINTLQACETRFEKFLYS